MSLMEFKLYFQVILTNSFDHYALILLLLLSLFTFALCLFLSSEKILANFFYYLMISSELPTKGV